MLKLLTRCSLVTAALFFGACQDATQPVATEGSGGSGNDTQCIGVVTGTHDNIVVPPGAACTVVAAIVRGYIKALPNAARLIVRNSQVNGSILADKSFAVEVVNNSVREKVELVEIQYSGPAVAEVAVCGNDITEGDIKVIKAEGSILVGVGVGALAPICATPNFVRKGNIQLEDNIPADAGLQVLLNRVAQNLQVYKSRGAFPVKLVQNNIVFENLQCFDNDPPFVGAPNAAKQAQGQCAAGLPLPPAFPMPPTIP